MTRRVRETQTQTEREALRMRTAPILVHVLFFLLNFITVCSQQRDIPYVAGLWEITYTYNELVGPLDNLVENPCSGPFPYRYTWRVRIYQDVDTEADPARTTGLVRTCWEEWMDCPSEARVWNIAEGSPEIVRANCIFRAYDEHPLDWSRFPGYREGGYQRKLFPTDKNTDPVPERLWSNFHVAREAPFMFGTFCNQFSWYDEDIDIKVAPPYAGSWRHENETWVFLRDISSCPCFPSCVECEEQIPGTMFKQVKDDGGECLGRYGTKPQVRAREPAARSKPNARRPGTRCTENAFDFAGAWA